MKRFTGDFTNKLQKNLQIDFGIFNCQRFIWTLNFEFEFNLGTIKTHFLQILSKSSKCQNLPNIFLNSQSHEHLNKNHSTGFELEKQADFLRSYEFFSHFTNVCAFTADFLRTYFVYHENRRLTNKNRQKVL